eukprot:TRINITY_DN7332_c0_g1_i1.p1 TRINITY_DN7332_c0_g1~~TRINITY_DN7332_c0_g1_i1.p1  ORF type:complete len:169 (+),score=20.15 TRINITY_DN7332_c0_g1_i1:58-564(+)
MPLTESATRKLVTCRSDEAQCLSLSFEGRRFACYLVACMEDGFLLAVPDAFDYESAEDSVDYIRGALPVIVGDGEGFAEDAGAQECTLALLDCGTPVIKHLARVSKSEKKTIGGTAFWIDGDLDDFKAGWPPPTQIFARAKLAREENGAVEEFMTAARAASQTARREG